MKKQRDVVVVEVDIYVVYIKSDSPVWLSWAFVGLRWLFVGLRGCRGLYWLSLAVIDLCWPALALVGLRWLTVAFVG